MPNQSDASRRRFLQAGSFLAGLVAVLHADDKTKPLAPPDKQPEDLKLPEAPQRKIGWAVVGLGQLALEEVMPAFAEARLSKPVALVSGHPDKAKKVAAAYGVNPKAIYNYDNYDKMVDDPNIEVIYIILPNSMHAEFTIRGLKAGKHVLCEKPMAINSAECEKMIAASREAKRKLMIAYRLHYEPMNRKVMELCREKKFGAIQSISSSNCQQVKAPNIRLSKKLAGGPLGDIGIYSINATRYITGQEPTEVTAVSHQPKDDFRFREVPSGLAFTLRFPDGTLACCDCSFSSAVSRRYRVHCASGVIEMDPAFSYNGLRLFTESKGNREELRIREVNQFAAEMDHFSSCILNDRNPRTPGAEGLADMRIIEAIEEAARSGKTTKVKG